MISSILYLYHGAQEIEDLYIIAYRFWAVVKQPVARLEWILVRYIWDKTHREGAALQSRIESWRFRFLLLLCASKSQRHFREQKLCVLRNVAWLWNNFEVLYGRRPSLACSQKLEGVSTDCSPISHFPLSKNKHWSIFITED